MRPKPVNKTTSILIGFIQCIGVPPLGPGSCQNPSSFFNIRVDNEIHVNSYTVEPPFNEPLYSEVLDITNNILHPSNSKTYGKEPRYNETLL